MSQGSKECSTCGRPLPMEHAGPCPTCGDERTRTVVLIGLATETDTAIPITPWNRSIREYYERRPAALAAMVLLTIAASLVGVVIAGPVGVLAGLALGALSLAAGPWAITKVRHERIEKGAECP